MFCTLFVASGIWAPDLLKRSGISHRQIVLARQTVFCNIDGSQTGGTLMQAATKTATVSKKMLWTGRVISALPVLMLFFGGIMSFLKPPVVLQSLAHLGYPERLAVPLGIVEIVCALIYAIPRTSVFGAVLLTAYFGGATATHVRIGEVFITPVIFGILVWIGLYLREERVRELVPFRK
jgi:hypothetical protein